MSSLFRLLTCTLAAAAVMPLACSSTAEAWNVDCEQNSDCTLMPFGDPCRSCAEGYDPVNVADVGAILDDATGTGGTCPIWYEWTEDDCVARPDSAPTCNEGTCTATNNGEPCAPGGQGFCQGVD